MTKTLAIVLLGALAASTVSAQQSVIVDLNAKAIPFSKSDYDSLLDCTLTRHPDGTRDYAEYHLLRRNNQSVEQNEAAPASKLGMRIISDCFEFENGKPIPFSLDRLISDWGEFHRVYEANNARGPMTFSNSVELAKCALTHHNALVEEMLDLPRPMGALRYLGRFIGEQCQPNGTPQLDIDGFYGALDEAARSKAAEAAE